MRTSAKYVRKIAGMCKIASGILQATAGMWKIMWYVCQQRGWPVIRRRRCQSAAPGRACSGFHRREVKLLFQGLRAFRPAAPGGRKNQAVSFFNFWLRSTSHSTFVTTHYTKSAHTSHCTLITHSSTKSTCFRWCGLFLFLNCMKRISWESTISNSLNLRKLHLLVLLKQLRINI